MRLQSHGLEVTGRLGLKGIYLAHSRQVPTERPPFSELNKIAAMNLMLKGDRPPQPNSREISDGL